MVQKPLIQIKLFSDLYDVGLKDDTLALLHEANRNIEMAVKTHIGLTQRQTINKCVLMIQLYN